MALRYKIAVIGLFWLTLLTHSSTQAKENTYVVLNYHDIKDHLDPKDDPSTITTDSLVLQFNWLQKQGYNVIGMDDVLAAQHGTHPLPDKAVMLTFDDGYASFYERVFPLLKSFKYKAIQAIVGKWHEQQPCKVSLPSAHEMISEKCSSPPASVMTWEQLREIHNSGLVEIASHTYNLHKGIIGDPQHDELPATTSLFYDEHTQRYETQAAYKKRVLNDLIQNNKLIQKNIGKEPRIIVWPYGSNNQDVISIAKEAHLPFNMTLSDFPNNPSNPTIITRYFLMKTTDMDEFRSIVEGTLNSPRRRAEHTVRAMHVDLDYLYDPNPAQQQRNLDLLIERVYQLGANTVYLQAFSDTDGDGAAESLYFPNRHMPVRSDLFTHVAWRLKTRLKHVSVYAWMPVLAFHLPEQYQLPTVTATSKEKQGIYYRLSPFNSRVRKIVSELYEDLSRQAHFDGIIFHDDATLNDYEDASHDALETYKTWGLPNPILELRTDPIKKKEWAKAKTTYLTNFTLDLVNKVRLYQASDLLTARNIYALPVLNPEAEEWFAQSLESFLKTYNYTAIMAMPYMEGIPKEEHEAWLIRMAQYVSTIPDALNHTVFELQTTDWKSKKSIPTEIIASQMFTLHKNGILNLGYYPDDFPANHPDIKILRRYFAWEN
jgi:poly-beta-1,6-N-acetyl-D-glucosamine N-deacetylase